MGSAVSLRVWVWLGLGLCAGDDWGDFMAQRMFSRNALIWGRGFLQSLLHLDDWHMRHGPRKRSRRGR